MNIQRTENQTFFYVWINKHTTWARCTIVVCILQMCWTYLHAQYFFIQLNLLIAWSTITPYCIQHKLGWCKIQIIFWTHKRLLMGKVWGVYWQYFDKKWPCFNQICFFPYFPWLQPAELCYLLHWQIQCSLPTFDGNEAGMTDSKDNLLYHITRKIYWQLTWGKPRNDHGVIDTWIQWTIFQATKNHHQL